ncbi:energy transducer TonB [Algoriphagus terrigena]|uniref:energy transducer TonB n=1 Tax=Algoriphagus terrigena TaxID=344884 RepID=UPI000404500A|nr:energy transducer TonB [Algoriphagus terrigena]
MRRLLFFIPIFLLCNFALAQNYVRFLGKYDIEVKDTSKNDFTHFELIQEQGNVILVHRFLKDSTKIYENTILFDSLGNEIGSSKKEFFASRKTKSMERTDELAKEKSTKTFYENGALKSEVFLRDSEVVSEKYYNVDGAEIPKPEFSSPSPKDGVNGWNKYLASVLRYPQVARNVKAEGTVIVSFRVDEEGQIHDLTVLNRGESHDSLEREALRVVEEYPHRWVPATENGVPIETVVKLPLRFKLS